MMRSGPRSKNSAVRSHSQREVQAPAKNRLRRCQQSLGHDRAEAEAAP